MNDSSITSDTFDGGVQAQSAQGGFSIGQLFTWPFALPGQIARALSGGQREQYQIPDTLAIRQPVYPTGAWQTPYDEMPVMPMQREVIETLRANSYKLERESPVAVLALYDFLALHQGENNWEAGNAVIRLLRQNKPNRAAEIAARSFLAKAQTEEQRATFQLAIQEQAFLRVLHGKYANKIQEYAAISRIIEVLDPVADLLERFGSRRRQATARLILANCYRRLAEKIESHLQLEQTSQLVAGIIGDDELRQQLSIQVGATGLFEGYEPDGGQSTSMTAAQRKKQEQQKAEAEREHAQAGTGSTSGSPLS